MKVSKANDAVAIAKSHFKGLNVSMVLDYDPDHFVVGLIPDDITKGDEGLFAGVDKNTGLVTRFYPNADMRAFREAMKSREVKLE